MKPRSPRPFITLVVAAGAALLAGCSEPARQAAAPVPVTTAPAAASEPVVIARPNPAAANVSAPVAELARLHLSGLDETVVKAFAERSTNALSPTADELIYLKDIGLSPRVITALIQQTAKMREQTAAAAATVAASPANVAPVQPQPNVTIIAANTAPAPAAPAAPPAPQPGAVAPVAAPVPAPAPAPPTAAAATANIPTHVHVFYEHLQPYGTWLHVADYGWCWQPSVVVSAPGWRPYADRGRWLHTDCGWYWQSDYAWGWAPFHYGRWVQHTRSGWLWVPDTTWGPAWVVWRSSPAHCGWAPLPPGAVLGAGGGLFFRGERVTVGFDFGLPRHHYTFVPFNRFCDRNPHYYALAPTVVQNVFQQTTVINHIEVNNQVVVNPGVPASQVAVLTRSEIRKVSVRDAASDVRADRLDRLEKAGNDLVIFRPALNPNAPLKPMLLTNDKGEARPVLTSAGTLPGQQIKGRPVYDTTSTGVPVLTGYTTEPAASPAGQPVVVVNNTITTTAPVAAPVPVTTANPVTSNAPPPSQPATATKVFGLTPGTTVARRVEDRPATTPTVIIPNPADNSLFRPLTPPQPVTTVPANLTPPSTVAPSQTPVRAEVKKPQPTTAPAAPAPTTTTPYSPATRAPAPSSQAPTPTVTPVPTRPVPVTPTTTPPAAPAAPRPTVVLAPTPAPTPAPAASTASTSNKSDQEKRK